MVVFNPLPDRNIRAALGSLGRAQKPGGGVPAYTRWINRGIGRLLAAVAYTRGISPNTLTVLSALASLIGLAILVSVGPHPLLGFAVAVLLAFGYALDSADGQVARLSHSGSRRGEWLDHVVDAIRTPTIHLCILVALWRWTDAPAWLLVMTMVYAVISVGQFMSQILAEQLSPEAARPAESGGRLRSLMLLPIDMGAVCWMFVAWGFPPAFAVVYTAMFTLNCAYGIVSMRRKYQRLAGLHQSASMEVKTQ